MVAEGMEPLYFSLLRVLYMFGTWLRIRVTKKGNKDSEEPIPPQIFHEKPIPSNLRHRTHTPTKLVTMPAQSPSMEAGEARSERPCDLP